MTLFILLKRCSCCNLSRNRFISSGFAFGKLYSVLELDLVIKPKDFHFLLDNILLLFFKELFAAIIDPSPPMITNFILKIQRLDIRFLYQDIVF